MERTRIRAWDRQPTLASRMKSVEPGSADPREVECAQLRSQLRTAAGKMTAQQQLERNEEDLESVVCQYA